MNTRMVVVAALGVCLCQTGITAQKVTIPELIERMKPAVPTWGDRVREFVPRPFEEAVRGSDLIVEATLTKRATYMSPDETELFTDYEIAPLLVIAGRNITSAKPSGSTMILCQWGGDTMISGVPVSIHDENFPMLPTGQPLLLFLTFNKDSKKYQVFDGGTRAFGLDDGHSLRHLVSPPVQSYRRFHGMDVKEAVRHVHELGR